jgi:predicted ATPase
MVDLSSRPMQARTPQSVSDAVQALGEVLHEQSLLQPTVVALHDFHNADKESIELLRALIDRTERSRLALIGVYASRELAMRPVLRRFLHDLAGREDALRIQGA